MLLLACCGVAHFAVPAFFPGRLLRRRIILDGLSDEIGRKGEELICEEAQSVRDFWQWLSPIGVTPYNAFRTRQNVETPHAFSFKLFQDLMPEEAATVPHVPARPHHAHDVFCLNAFMRDTRLQQPPVLILPHDRSLWAAAAPEHAVPRHVYSEDRRRQLLQLAEQLAAPGLRMERAVSYVRSLLLAEEPRAAPPLEWLQNAAPAPAALPAAPIGDLFPHLPIQLWRLKCAFHRAV